MRSVVTGGAGFIGSHLVDALLGLGHDVTVIDDLSTGRPDRPGFAHPNCRFVEAELPEPGATAAIDAAEPDLIFHLAAQPSVPASIEDPFDDARRNIIASLAVLDAARRSGAKVLYAASGGALYGPDGPFPAQESQRWRPVQPYGISKGVVLGYLDFYRDHHGVQSAALALANIYGPRQSSLAEGGVVAIFAAAGSAGGTITIDGSGEQTRDFVYVGDVVDAFVAAADADVSGLINIGSGRETSINQLAEIVRGRCPDVTVQHGPARPMDVLRSSLSAERARELLGWGATTPLSDGVGAVIDEISGTNPHSAV